MARNDTATVETEAQNGETAEQNETKRQRIDPATLEPDTKVSLLVPVPAGLRVALRKVAEEKGVSEAQYVRDLLAVQMEYSVPESFNERKRRVGAYAGMTEEQKKEAIAAQAAEKRANVAKMLETIQSNAALAEQLKAAGIDIDALPKPKAAKAS
jgi:hypothetical protein